MPAGDVNRMYRPLRFCSSGKAACPQYSAARTDTAMCSCHCGTVMSSALCTWLERLLTALWIGPSQELARHWLAGRTRISLTEAAPVLADAAWKSLNSGG